MVKTAAKPPVRVYFMDYLRYWLVLGVVMFHAALAQTIVPGGWVVDDPRRTPLAFVIVRLFDVFQMPLMFFIAGYFALPSLASRSWPSFILAKVRRLLLPAALVYCTLNPAVAYLVHRAHGFGQGRTEMPYLQFWPQCFTGLHWFRRGALLQLGFSLQHLWFVVMLFVFFVVTAVMRRGLSRCSSCEPTSHSPHSRSDVLRTLALANIAVFAACAIVLRVIPAFQWVLCAGVIQCQFPHVALYVVYYCLGIIAHRCQWFAQPGPFGPDRPWLAAGTLLASVFLGFAWYITVHPEFRGSYIVMLAYWILRASLCLVCLVVLFSAAMRWCNHPSRIQQYLAVSSYRLYLTHMVVVVYIQYAFLQRGGLPALPRLLAVITVSVAASHAVAASLAGPAKAADRMMSQRDAELPKTVDPVTVRACTAIQGNGVTDYANT